MEVGFGFTDAGMEVEDAEEVSFGLMEVDEDVLREGLGEGEVVEEDKLCGGDLFESCLFVSCRFFESCCLATLADHVAVLLASLFCFSRVIISLIIRNLSSISLFSSSSC